MIHPATGTRTPASDWLGDGPDPLYVAVGLLVSAACFVAAVLWFRRKDLTG